MPAGERARDDSLMRVGSGHRKTFAQREGALNQWIAEHARVAWLPTHKPKELESQLISSLDLPLNLDGNVTNTCYPILVNSPCGKSASVGLACVRVNLSV
jgi:hypothetical protein